MKKHSLLVLLFLITSATFAQEYYQGKIRSTTTTYQLSKKKKPKKKKSKIYIRHVILDDSIRMDVIIKNRKNIRRHSKTFFRYYSGRVYPDFRLYIKQQKKQRRTYIRSGNGQKLDFFDGLFRSLLPQYKFYHEKHHPNINPNLITNLYNISFDYINTRAGTYMHKFYFSKSLKMESLHYIANGKFNGQQESPEVINIEANFWKGSSARPYLNHKQVLEIQKPRKKKKREKIKALFEN